MRDVKESMKQIIDKIDKPRSRNDQFRGKPNRNKKSIQCFNCGRHGHYSFECRGDKNNRQEITNKNAQQKLPTAIVKTDGTNDGDLN